MYKFLYSNLIFEIGLLSRFDPFSKLCDMGVVGSRISMWTLIWLDCVDLATIREGKAQVLDWLWLIKASEPLKLRKSYRILEFSFMYELGNNGNKVMGYLLKWIDPNYWTGSKKKAMVETSE